MIDVTAAEAHEESLEKLVDEDLAAFDKWFQERTGSQPLVPSERAILKTYLWYKLRGKNAPADKTDPVEAGHGA